MVESPGTAPGSEPLITGAFIAIVWVTPSTATYRRVGAGAQGALSDGGAPQGLMIAAGCAYL
jgi:hypothetical protein